MEVTLRSQQLVVTAQGRDILSSMRLILCCCGVGAGSVSIVTLWLCRSNPCLPSHTADECSTAYSYFYTINTIYQMAPCIHLSSNYRAEQTPGHTCLSVWGSTSSVSTETGSLEAEASRQFSHPHLTSHLQRCCHAQPQPVPPRIIGTCHCAG